MTLHAPPVAEALCEQDSKSFVYVIASDGGPVKIGISADPLRRLIKAQTDSPVRLRLAHMQEVPAASCALIEHRAHMLSKASRVAGEWYDLSVEEAIEAIHRATIEVRAGWVYSRAVEPAPMSNLRRTDLADGLDRLFRFGQIDIIQFRAGDRYRRAYRASELSVPMRGEVMASLAAKTDGSKLVAKLDSLILQHQSRTALDCFKLVVGQGRTLGSFVKGRAWYQLSEIIRRGLQSIIDGSDG